MCDTFRSLLLLFFVASLCHVIYSSQVKQVTTEEFRETIEKEKYVLVLFYYDTDTCTRCADAEKEIEKVQTPEMFDQDIVKVKCDDPGTAVKYGVHTIPQLIFFRKASPVLYEIPEDTRVILWEDVTVWLDNAKTIATQTLYEDSFEHLTQASTGATTGDWLVIFYNSACQSYLSAIEGAAIELKQRMNVAKVDTDINPVLATRFGIKECPTTYFFRQGKMYLYFSDDKNHYDIKSLRLFATSWYKNVKAVKVPSIPTYFEKLTESIAMSLKEKMNSPKRNQFLIIIAIVLAVIAFIVSLVVVLCAKRKDVKTE
ncbi:uncharacterized protein LOC127731691 [Mytilus californianus]|uniref:uncharacterized protein LOC127731691 n=1 Tax=Mytilus californianus TaxID=6549 RepID=UPI0022466D23|nr:uncharacterized protein LOC127731691 [Mytilus californianus]